MTDFRALCAELHAAFNTYAVDMKHHDLLKRARAALTEPKPPSLKEQALAALKSALSPSCPNQMRMLTPQQHDLIRLVLEALPE
jgi:hypothetical protein